MFSLQISKNRINEMVSWKGCIITYYINVFTTVGKNNYFYLALYSFHKVRYIGVNVVIMYTFPESFSGKLFNRVIAFQALIPLKKWQKKVTWIYNGGSINLINSFYFFLSVITYEEVMESFYCSLQLKFAIVSFPNLKGVSSPRPRNPANFS